MTHPLWRATLTLSALALTSTLTLSACDTLEDAVKADPQRSTCQAYCEWAVSCQAAARELDAELTLAACLEQTRAANSTCAEMEEEGINQATSQLYASCVEAVDELRASMSCEAITGDAIAINSATPPTACASVAYEDLQVFNSARLATSEPNDELCERVSQTLCERSTSCLISEYNVPSSALEQLDPPALERCLSSLESGVTNACKEQELYALDQEMAAKADAALVEALPEVFFSVNASREAARACLMALEEVSCGAYLSGELPPVCAGAFSDVTEAASGLSGFACGLEREELAPLCGG